MVVAFGCHAAYMSFILHVYAVVSILHRCHGYICCRSGEFTDHCTMCRFQIGYVSVVMLVVVCTVYVRLLCQVCSDALIMIV